MKTVLVLPPAEKISEKKDTPTHQHVGLGYLASILERNGPGASDYIIITSRGCPFSCIFCMRALGS